MLITPYDQNWPDTPEGVTAHMNALHARYLEAKQIIDQIPESRSIDWSRTIHADDWDHEGYSLIAQDVSDHTHYRLELVETFPEFGETVIRDFTLTAGQAIGIRHAIDAWLARHGIPSFATHNPAVSS